jgi:hypothetical protein
MLAKRGVTRLIGLATSMAMVGLVVAGCVPGKAQPTPVIIVITPTPITSATPSPTPLPTVAPTPIETPTTVVPTPVPTLAAVSADVCTGSVDNKTFWGIVAGKMRWDVYCAVLPSGWRVAITGGSYDTAAGGKVTMRYAGPGGATLQLDEGAFCIGSATICAPSSGVVGEANFGDLPGSLVSLDGGGLALYVAPGTAKAYKLTATGVTQEKLMAIASTLAKVAKP